MLSRTKSLPQNSISMLNPTMDVENNDVIDDEGSAPTKFEEGPLVDDGSNSEVVMVSNVEASVDLAEIVDGASEKETQVAPFVPSLGAWAKPLKISSDPPPSSSTTFLETNSNLLNELSSPSQWPTIAVGSQVPSKRVKQLTHKTRDKHLSAVKPLAEELPPPEVMENGRLRFPWAAKLNPSMRNLYRATTPSYMEDGTPKVTIPSHILLHGPENQREYVVGQFYRCSPPSGGLIHAVVNRIWGRNCRVFNRKLSESSYLFHIPDESTRTWVLQRGLWHVDDCLMFVASYSPAATLSLPEITTVPVWVKLKSIPERLYSRPGISHIASGIGEPIVTNKPRLDPTLMGEAKILVEVELDKPFPQKIALVDEYGTISMVDVEYSWIPSKCGRCGHLGHKEPRCLQQPPLKERTECVESTNRAPPSVSITGVSLSGLVSSAAVDPITTSVDEITGAHDSDTTVSTSTPTLSSLEHVSLATTQDALILESAMPSATTHSHGKDLNQSTTTTITATKVVPITATTDKNFQDAISMTKDVENETIVAFSTADTDIATPPPQSEGSSRVNEDVAGMCDNNGVLTGYENMDELSHRSRGGRPFKPTQKMQELQWTIASGRGHRGRGGRGGRGPNN